MDLITSAKKAYSYTLYYPKYEVINPFFNQVKIGIVAPLTNDEVWRDYINGWIKYRIKDGSFDSLYKQCILGKPFQKKEKKWSIYTDVLGLE
tara:strand:+ start:606 stop:881 length:276 start_codon:yes stop_codon:yes gene_type:complete